MKRNHKDRNRILDEAIAAVRDEQLDTATTEPAMQRAWQRISEAASAAASPAHVHIEGCGDVRELLPAYQAGKLSAAKALLVSDHLRECATCRVEAKQKSRVAVLPWRADSVLRSRQWGFGQYALAASLLIAAVLGIGIGRSGLLAPRGYRAALEEADGPVYRVDAAGEHRAQVGEQFGDRETLRTASGSRARLRLRDGSLVEMNSRSQLYVTLGLRSTTVHLDRGAVIVQAAKRRTGHLYLDTSDARVAVTGTIFSVNAGLKGSRVSVIEGVVHVAQASGDSVLNAGDQVTTNTSVAAVPVRDEISWSEDRDKYLALLAEFAKIQHHINAIPLPGLRYQTDLLPLVPQSAIVVAAIPNYGEAIAQANSIFQAELSQSAVLREWWQQQGPGRTHNGLDFNQAMNTLHSLSQFVGDELMVAVYQNGQRSNPVAMADVVRPGLRDFINAQMAQHAGDGNQNLHLLTPEDLGSTVGDEKSLYVLIAPDFVAASPDVPTLSAVYNQHRSHSGSGFTQGDFGQRIASEYKSGAGLLVAVDLATITARQRQRSPARPHDELVTAGFANVKYLIAQRKDVSGKTSNAAELSFSGPRTGIASWLAAPAPIGALDYVTPNAAAVGAFVSKSPAAMVDDLLQMASSDNGKQQDLARAQAELNFDIRNDLAASLGGEGAMALDGPLLPTPSWKLIVEVNDPNRLQFCLQKLVESANRHAAEHKRPQLALTQQQVSGATYYTIRSNEGVVPFEMHYTFSGGYLIAAASQAMVQEAIKTRANGDSISHSDSFRALFPTDQHANVSGIIYQNLAPIMAPIADQLTPSQAQSLGTIVANTEPTVICFYGDESDVQIASNSKTLGFDLKSLAISALLRDMKSGTLRPQNP